MLVLRLTQASRHLAGDGKSITFNMPFRGKGGSPAGGAAADAAIHPSSDSVSAAVVARISKATLEPPGAAAPIGKNKLVVAGAWQVSASNVTFQALSNVRMLSPVCAGGLEATSCGAFSGNTAVVVSSQMPAVGTASIVKTTQCFCDFRNTVNFALPANANEVYRCAVYCQ